MPNSSTLESTETLRKSAQAEPFVVPSAWRLRTGRTTSMIESFYHAIVGIGTGLKEQRNLRIHFCLSLIVIGAGFALKVDTVSWLALVLSIGLVIGCELLNTAIEHVVDLSAGGQFHLAAQKAKDTAAAAVFVAALCAVVIGLIVFLPRLSALFPGLVG